jgi:hypothetical protein
MNSWLDPEETNDKLADDYYEWLEETCHCADKEKCDCLTLDEWIDQLPEPDFDEDLDDGELVC